MAKNKKTKKELKEDVAAQVPDVPLETKDVSAHSYKALKCAQCLACEDVE